MAQNRGFSDLNALAAALPGVSVLVAGDLMLDRFVYGDVHRISPESPVPVLSIRSEDAMLGGAGNVLSNLHGLGVRPVLLAAVAADEPGTRLRGLVRACGADETLLLEVSDRPTTIKTRYLAAHQQLLRTDFEKIKALEPAAEQALLAKAERAIKGAGAVVLSDYGKGVLTPVVIEGLIRLARAQNIPVLVDPKGGDYAIYRGAAVVTPNRKELSEATKGAATGSDQEVVAAATGLIERTGINAVVATRSQDGMSIVRARADGKGYEEPVHLRTQALEVFDVSGAGDTVIATIAAGLAVGADLVQAAALANVAAGVVVAKVGTAPILQADLQSRLKTTDVDVRADGAGAARVIDRFHEAPVCSWAEAADQVRRWKIRGLKVVFTNGCFDILHRGHVDYLNQARARCDRLVIGLNADASVRRLKGAGRPVNDQDARAAVLAALGAVDMVVIFGSEAAEDDKPLEIIRALSPAMAFKGGDYRMEDLPEAALVKSLGGEMVIMPHYEGHSTTGTIKKIGSGG